MLTTKYICIINKFIYKDRQENGVCVCVRNSLCI